MAKTYPQQSVVRLLAVFFLLLPALFSGAQPRYSISMKFVDESTSDPVGFATVSITLKGHDTASGYILSTAEGNARLSVAVKGTYVLKAELMGYISYQKEILIDKSMDLGELKMKPDVEVLEAASCRYARIRDGIFAREVKEALKNLFLTDPRFQARLSKSDDLDEAVCEVQGRVLSQCRFSWGMMIFSPVDWRAEGIRLMSLMQQEIYSRTAHLGDDAQMMSAQRFKRLTAFYERFSQFAGLDPRFDRALADMRKLLSALPDDAAYLYGGGL